MGNIIKSTISQNNNNYDKNIIIEKNENNIKNINSYTRELNYFINNNNLSLLCEIHRKNLTLAIYINNIINS